MKLFQFFTTTFFFVFIAIFTLVLFNGYGRYSGVTKMSMAKIQKTRHDAHSQNSDNKHP